MIYLANAVRAFPESSQCHRRYFRFCYRYWGVEALTTGWLVTLWNEVVPGLNWPLGGSRIQGFRYALIPIETDLIKWYEPEPRQDDCFTHTRLHLGYISSQVLIIFWQRLASKPGTAGRYKNADFLAIPKSWPLSLRILHILSYPLVSFPPSQTLWNYQTCFFCVRCYFSRLLPSLW